ncbi:M56 family metallopeptidase [Clostridiales bacterium COT073_COT-073]|nr:M56 family metallopeptidase [Clostridiales bacterium COT073_COT-073]
MSIIAMSLQASVMIILILIMRKLLWEKLPKLAFPILWGLVLFRLLVPISMPSAFSIYNLWKVEVPVGELKNIIEAERNILEKNQGQVTLFIPNRPHSNQVLSRQEDKEMDIWQYWNILWLLGVILNFCFFLIIYYRNQKKIKPLKSVEVDAWIMEWQKRHSLLRSMKILESSAINTPISYGIFNPKIILPPDLDRQNKTKLHYILTHEFCHIKRWDALWKWLMVVGVCLHWMNPLVWLMMYYFNRDLEVSCDEMVLSKLVGEHRAEYAYFLLEMAQTKDSFSPMYNYFSKNAAKERIVAIMKYKKLKFSLIMLSIGLTILMGIIFTTSAKLNQSAQKPNATHKESPAFLQELFHGNRINTTLNNEEKENLINYSESELEKLEALLLPKRLFPKGTEADYRSLLSLKEAYQDKFLLEFNQEISNWADENEGSSDRIMTDIIWNDIPDYLTQDEKDFIWHTFYYSGTEIAALNRAKYTDSAVSNPIIDLELSKTNDAERMWININLSFSYQMFYHLSSHRITVLERDEAVSGFIGEVLHVWEKMTNEEALAFSEKQENIDSWLEALCQKYSNEKIKFSITHARIQKINEEHLQN